MVTVDLEFTTSGHTLSGIISQPAHTKARALVVFIHGYGKTDVRGWDMYSELRSRFAALGIASVTWDKPGQGRSEGSFDINQPVASSAHEVMDAITHLRTRQIPGAQRIGLWGISRAGWIAPMVLARDRAIRFWISVGGVTAEDNYFYLLKSNLSYEGSTPEEAEAIMQEWKDGVTVLRRGGSYDEYCAATPRLRANTYVARMGGLIFTRSTFEREQNEIRTRNRLAEVDPETWMPIYVQAFDTMLSALEVDVLALFGEKDRNVDWRKTRAFYESTIGRNRAATLTIQTFPEGNHNIDVSLSGSLREMESMRTGRKCDGFFEAQVEWLQQHVLE